MALTDTATASRAYKPASGAARLAQRQMLARAVTLLRERQTAQAAPLLQSILARWPGQPDALHFLGVLRHGEGRSDEGEALIRQSLASHPDQPGAWNNLGNVLIERQQFDTAVQAYEQCLHQRPDHIDALNNLATIYRKRGEHAQSERLCRRALAARPEFAQAWYNLSLTLLEQGRIDEGLQANSRAIVLWPRHLQARDAVPRALVHLGRLSEAAQLYREWLATDPGNPVIAHHLAACTGQAGASAVPARASDAYVEQTFDAFAATFDANLSALGYRAPQLVADLLAELLPAPAHQFDLLDLGCGTGLCGPLVRPWARCLDGCDLSAGMLEKARPRGSYDTLRHAELVADLRAHPARYDALICADTLCYFGELGEALAAAKAALRPGGHFVFTVEALLAEGDGPYHLQAHGRYAHREGYLTQCANGQGWHLTALRQETLRREAGRPVIGWLVALSRPAAA